MKEYRVLVRDPHRWNDSWWEWWKTIDVTQAREEAEEARARYEVLLQEREVVQWRDMDNQ